MEKRGKKRFQKNPIWFDKIVGHFLRMRSRITLTKSWKLFNFVNLLLNTLG